MGWSVTRFMRIRGVVLSFSFFKKDVYLYSVVLVCLIDTHG